MIVAVKNKMDLAYGIAVGSSLQIALLVAPVLVFASYLWLVWFILFIWLNLMNQTNHACLRLYPCR